jgi:hypothetical protein
MWKDTDIAQCLTLFDSLTKSQHIYPPSVACHYITIPKKVTSIWPSYFGCAVPIKIVEWDTSLNKIVERDLILSTAYIERPLLTPEYIPSASICKYVITIDKFKDTKTKYINAYVYVDNSSHCLQNLINWVNHEYKVIYNGLNNVDSNKNVKNIVNYIKNNDKIVYDNINKNCIQDVDSLCLCTKIDYDEHGHYMDNVIDLIYVKDSPKYYIPKFTEGIKITMYGIPVFRMSTLKCEKDRIKFKFDLLEFYTVCDISSDILKPRIKTRSQIHKIKDEFNCDS